MTKCEWCLEEYSDSFLEHCKSMLEIYKDLVGIHEGSYLIAKKRLEWFGPDLLEKHEKILLGLIPGKTALLASRKKRRASNHAYGDDNED